MIVLFIDTETTGIPNKPEGFKPALVQLAAILQEVESGRVLAELNLVANQYPGKDIPAEMAQIHGIDDEMAALVGVDPKLIDLVLSELALKADRIVAHNIAFDMQIIQLNLPVTARVIEQQETALFCTQLHNVYEVRKPYDPAKTYDKEPLEFGYPSLMETYKHYFVVEFGGAHDAMLDAKACRDIFLEMVRRKTLVV